MQLQDKSIKGFNILELLVVIAIIGIISAVAYPNFSDWRKERAARGSTVKIQNLIQGINAQVQRGLYAYVQVLVENTNDSLTVTSKGMKMDTLTTMINNGESTWNTNPTSRCDTTTSDYWDDEGSPTIKENDEGEEILVPNEKLEVAQLILEKVTTNFAGSEDSPSTGAVCFSKNARWYSGGGNFLSGTGSETSVDSILFICTRNTDFKTCDVDELGEPKSEHENLFLVEWTRFGEVTMSKYNWRDADWVLQ